MRIQQLALLETAPCFNMMEEKSVNGESTITEIKYSPTSCRDSSPNANGILSPPTTPSATTPVDSDYSPNSGAGRLKFFKDGKFILELWRQRNGERMLWIPVSKSSTYWPSVGHYTPRQESSTSLSVSDDNSSVQSSPWQRDHCWKQNRSRKNISKEMEFMMHVSLRRKKNLWLLPAAHKKRGKRRPYDIIKMDLNGTVNEICKKRGRKNISKSYKFDEVIQRLWERRTSENVISSCRADPGIVSPRKRILKEMEKVSLEELGGNINKKHRTRTSGCITTNTTISTKPISSHSITSILAKEEEPSFLRNLLKSPCSDVAYDCSRNIPTTEPLIPSNRSRCSTPVSSSLSPPSSSNITCPQPIPAYHHLPAPYLYQPGSSYVSSPPSPALPAHPSYYSSLQSNYNAPSAWALRSISSLPRPPVYQISYPLSPPHWIPVAHSSFPSYSPPDGGADVPLNLSKNSS